MTRFFVSTVQVFVVEIFLASTLALAQTPAAQPDAAVINPGARTVTTSNFLVTWNTGVDSEAITNLIWRGGQNLTSTYELDTCGSTGRGGNVFYFGNGWGPPDPQSGGEVLVGGGTVTPSRMFPWFGEILPSGTAEITVNSRSSYCPPSSEGVDVQTTYRFPNPSDFNVDWFQVQRVFNFTNAPFAHDLRPYIPRLNTAAGYTEVLYPATNGTLASISALNCTYGCTGPVSAPGASQLSPPWKSAKGWFAIHNPNTQRGVVVKRTRSQEIQGNAAGGQLWVDSDYSSQIYATNASSVLFLSPSGGFRGLLSETETFCFYDSTIWTPSLTPPSGCRDTTANLSPSTLTFASQPTGTISVPQVATLRNAGSVPIVIKAITANGDYIQQNNCPYNLLGGESCIIDVFFEPLRPGIRSGAVSIVYALAENNETISLTGLAE